MSEANILIVEDEAVVARRLMRLVREVWGNALGHLRHAASLPAAEVLLAENEIDLLFLDLNVKGRDGFDLLTAAVAGAFHTIVVSAHADQAIRAYEYGVFDFIAKPFSKARLETTFARLTAPATRTPQPATVLAIRSAGRIDLVRLSDVRLINGADSYAELALYDGRRLLYGKTLDRLETLLPEYFVRIHRSHIVRVADIQALTSSAGSRYTAELVTGEELPIGRTRLQAVRERLSGGGVEEWSG